jgi:predicted signal transduction protein with EAL and GGDEF domain
MWRVRELPRKASRLSKEANRQRASLGIAASVRGGVAGAALFAGAGWVYASHLTTLRSAGPDHWALWPLIALGAFASEHHPVKIHSRRVNLSVGSTELPALAGIVYLSPLLVLTALTAGVLCASILQRRKPAKIAISLGTLVAVVAMGTAFYDHFLQHSSPVSPKGWSVAGLTLILMTLVDMVVLLSAASFHELHWWVPPFRRLAFYLGGALVVSYVAGMMAVLLIWVNPWTAILFSLVLTGGERAFQGTRAAHDRYSEVSNLYELTRELLALTSTRDVMSTALGRVSSLAHADRAEVVLPVDTGEGQLAVRCSFGLANGLAFDEEDGLRTRDVLVNEALPFRERTPCEVAGVLEVLGDEGFHDAMAASLERGKKGCGYLLISDPAYHNYSFTQGDLNFLEALAATLGMALRSSEAMERLRRELATRQYQARHDPLTGLPNREQFLQGLEQVIASNPASAVAAVLVDLDGFKEVNDTLGHETGDAVLGEVARRLQDLGAPGTVAVPWLAKAAHDPAFNKSAATKAGGPVEVGTAEWFDGEGTTFWRKLVKAPGEEPAARLGGDEFAVLLVKPSTDMLEEACGKVLGVLTRPYEVESLSLDLRASVGVAMSAPDIGGRDATGLMRHAEVAMYLAKSSGGGTRFYTPAEDRMSLRRLSVATELRRAVETEGLDVWYQPVVELTTGRLVGCEALLRWNHERFGPVSPTEFVPVAESSGLIDPITWWVLDRSLQRLVHWRGRVPGLTVSVNLSARSLATGAVAGRVADALSRHSLPPNALTLELTESSTVRDTKRSEAAMSELSELGVNLAIDDYGTGFSSLSRLKALPFDDLKIDRLFVKDIVADRGDEAIVRSTIELARALGRTVTAEGVEDEATLERLAILGCTAAQGFYLARPLPSVQFEVWVESWPAQRRANIACFLPAPRIDDPPRLMAQSLPRR